MTEYKLNIKIDQNMVKKFKTGGLRLCLGFGFDTTARPGSTKFNVIGYSSVCARNLVVTWRDDYSIAGTMSAFSSGVKFDVATAQQPIAFGESWTLPPDWTDGFTSSDEKAPGNGFIFNNLTSSASAVVYKTVNGVEAPVHVSQFGPLPPGSETLTPKPLAAVWFQPSAETGAMIDKVHDSSLKVIDFEDVMSHEIEYGPSGSWTIVD
ncbi:hypothetical protein CORC01_13406 [Colletotrichum orchidophilum]|uniref:Uncharacterized protein n=1 Tax=Colletotrichum orchidophilum TaxID=1209926 RepID=A0A1G4AQB4_9PEZI|nr:uncharacterized protein CORC01_13406 [Colletotrichum orchidophilum]OHE91291.1 hypothetical protein CORC01_13406 [Colletotrichum orchidophilum]